MNQRTANRERGYALLMVLIALGLVAILLGVLESGAREDARTAIGLRDQAEAQAAADGAIWTALWQVIPAHTSAWTADTSPHDLMIGGASVRVAAEDLADRVDLNRDSAAAVAVVLRGGGIDPGIAQAVSAKLIDWRSGNPNKEPLGAKLPDYRAAGLPYGPPNTDYENLGEAELVLGMTPAIAKILASGVTIYAFGQPQLTAVRNALELEALETALHSQPVPPTNPPVVFFYSLTARARTGDAVAFRHAVVRLDIDASNQGKFWRVMDWD